MLVWILSAVTVASLLLVYIVYFAGQRARMNLAATISALYLDERQMKLFESAYEAFVANVPPDLDRGTRGAQCAAFIERYAAHVSLKSHGMMFLGMSRIGYETHRAARLAEIRHD